MSEDARHLVLAAVVAAVVAAVGVRDAELVLTAEALGALRVGEARLAHPGAAAGPPGAPRAAVTLAVAKRRGSNAVAVTEQLRHRLEELRAEVLPADVDWTITRDSGRTADGKVEELLEGLYVAIAIVVVLITMLLGWREAVVVALAVPITFGLSLRD